MGTEKKTGTSERFFFPLKGKDLGEEKRREEPVHDSFTLLDKRKSENWGVGGGKRKTDREKQGRD